MSSSPLIALSIVSAVSGTPHATAAVPAPILIPSITERVQSLLTACRASEWPIIDYAVTCTVPRRDVTDLLIQVRETIPFDAQSPLGHTVESLSGDCTHRRDENSCLVARPDIESISYALTSKSATDDSWYVVFPLELAGFLGIGLLWWVRARRIFLEQIWKKFDKEDHV